MPVVFDEVLGSVPARDEAPAAPAPTGPRPAADEDRRLATALARLRERRLRVRAS